MQQPRLSRYHHHHRHLQMGQVTNYKLAKRLLQFIIVYMYTFVYVSGRILEIPSRLIIATPNGTSHDIESVGLYK